MYPRSLTQPFQDYLGGGGRLHDTPSPFFSCSFPGKLYKTGPRPHKARSLEDFQDYNKFIATLLDYIHLFKSLFHEDRG